MTASFARARPTLYPGQGPTAAGVVAVSGISSSVTTTVTGSVVANPTTSATFTTAQVTITASATQLFAANASTIFREVVNPPSSGATIFLGSTSSVTVTTGHEVPESTAFDFQFNSSAVWGIVSTGSVTVSTVGW